MTVLPSHFDVPPPRPILKFNGVSNMREEGFPT